MSGPKISFKTSWVFDKTALLTAIAQGCQRAGLEIILRVQDAVTVNLSQPGTGKVYRIHGREHRASAPGRPPAAYSGRLRSSWEAGKPSGARDGGRIGWRLGSSVEYARRLEFGGPPIAARPYLRPAIDAVSPSVPEIFSAAIRRSLKESLSDSAGGASKMDEGGES